MLTLKTLSTGSQGNCYLLSTESETLILDAGIPIMEIKKGLNFNISKVVGVLCTHSHKDHSLSLKDFENMGIPVFTPYKYKKIENLRRDEMHVRHYGSFNITSFQLPHNGVSNVGYFITVGNEKIVYLTDFEYCPYKFTAKKYHLNHILVECNYQQELVNRDLPNYEHKIRGHCSLQTCKDFVQANVTDSLRTVLLLHMGGETCNPMECVAEIQKVVKNSVYVDYARKGLEIELKTDECPF